MISLLIWSVVGLLIWSPVPWIGLRDHDPNVTPWRIISLWLLLAVATGVVLTVLI